MKIEFTEHHINKVGNVFFATDRLQDDCYVNAIRDVDDSKGPLYEILNDRPIRYILNRYKNTTRFPFKAKPKFKFIDIGANIGTYTLPIAKYGIKTLAIEANPKNFSLLTEAIYKNRLRNVTLVHAAATDRPGIMMLNGDSAWGYITDSGNGIPIPAVTVDTLSAIYDFADADIIKMDVEGAELSVLEGMKHFLKNNSHAEIIFESNAVTCGRLGYSVKKLKRFFEELGYHLYCFNDMTLNPSSSYHFQERVFHDYLATKKPLAQLNEFTIRPLNLHEKIATVLGDTAGNHICHLAYFVGNLETAPAEIKNDASIQARLAEILTGPDPELHQLVNLIRIGAH